MAYIADTFHLDPTTKKATSTLRQYLYCCGTHIVNDTYGDSDYIIGYQVANSVGDACQQHEDLVKTIYLPGLQGWRIKTIGGAVATRIPDDVVKKVVQP